MKRIGVVLVAVFIVASGDGGVAQRSATLRVQATSLDDVRRWDGYVTQQARNGALRVRRVDRDPALPNRTLERLAQFHEGVPVWGAEVVRDSERGVPYAIFGAVASDLTLSTQPALDRRAAVSTVAALAGTTGRILRQPELVILPLAAGGHALAYTAVLALENGVFRIFIDAHDGTELMRYSELQTQAAVGTGRGVLGDTKKLSVRRDGAIYRADDQLRPPVLVTYDARNNFARALDMLEGAPALTQDLASDSDNDWNDVAAVDGHTHIGWSYDYYYKRHGRRGLDNQDRPIASVINALTPQAALAAPPDVLGQFVLNAFWCGVCGQNGAGMMFFGNGIPSGFIFIPTGQHIGYMAGGLDVVAHELTHAVIDSSSQLIYMNESGALNEAFADMMGTSVEFFYQTPGNGLGQADYLLAEDVVRGVVMPLNGFRSMSNPSQFGDPDHYSLRYVGPADGGGVHTNSAIANQAFYLAIEGGTNRTSGLPVQGVGAANREQIERVFYRAFVFMLTPSATFSMARATTIQAARDLYGANSAAERAVTQAWTAVGVF